MAAPSNPKSLQSNGSHRVRRVVIFALLTMALLVTQNVTSYVLKRNEANADAMRQRASEAKLAAAVVEGRLARMTDLATSLSTRVAFSTLVADGKWDEAVQIMIGVPASFKDVDRIFLADSKGTLMVDYPALEGTRGRDFSYRDWYQGVSKEWKPYVSEAYTRAALPAINVVAVAAPIRRPQTAEVVGILVLQIPLHRVGGWSSEFDFGPDSTVSVIDANGHSISARASAPSAIADLSGDPQVQAAIGGKSGVEVVATQGGQSELVAYAGVRERGWGIVIRQPVGAASAHELEEARNDALADLLFLVLFLPLAFMMIQAARRYERSRQALQLVFAGADGALVLIDARGVVTSWSIRMEVLTGWSEQEALGKPLNSLLLMTQGPYGEEGDAFVHEAMRNGGVRVAMPDTQLVRKDGTVLPVVAEAGAMTDDDGKVSGVAVVFREDANLPKSPKQKK